MAKLSLHNLNQAGRFISTSLGILKFDAEGVLENAEQYAEAGLRALGNLHGFRLIDLEAIEKAKKAVEDAKKEDEKAKKESVETKDTSEEVKAPEGEAPVKKSRKNK